MVIVQEILPDEGTFQSLRRLPAQAAIELAVSRNRLVRDLTHVTQPEVELQMGPDIQGLTQEPLMTRIMRFRAAERRVRAAGFGPDVKSQLRVTGSQAPPVAGSVLRGQLRSVGGAGLPVPEHDGKGCRGVD